MRSTLETPGDGRVLVVDGGASLRCALVGDVLAALGQKNGWAGILVFGAVRDSEVLGTMDFGICALGTNPVRSVKAQQGAVGVTVNICDVLVHPGDWVFADADGVVVSRRDLRDGGDAPADASVVGEGAR